MPKEFFEFTKLTGAKFLVRITDIINLEEDTTNGNFLLRYSYAEGNFYSIPVTTTSYNEFVNTDFSVD